MSSGHEEIRVNIIYGEALDAQTEQYRLQSSSQNNLFLDFLDAIATRA